MSESVIIEKDLLDTVQILTIKHHRRTNPWDMSVMQALVQRLQEAQYNPQVKSIILTGGVRRAFSVGGDLEELQKMAEEKILQQWVDIKNALFDVILSMSKPVVVAIDKYCIGLGFVYALMFDWRIATEKTQFSLPELPNGVEGSIVVEVVSEVAGLNTARHLLYRTEPLPASDIQSMNLIDEVVPAEELMDKALSMAKLLGSYPEETLASTKQTMAVRLDRALKSARTKDQAFMTESRLFRDVT